MSAPEHVPDELENRIRSLEAERARPVPPPPMAQKRPTTDAERNAAQREAHDLYILDEHLAELARRRAVLEEIDTEEEAAG